MSETSECCEAMLEMYPNVDIGDGIHPGNATWTCKDLQIFVLCLARDIALSCLFDANVIRCIQYAQFSL